MLLRHGNIPTISMAGTKILQIEEDWLDEARERGLVNPIKVRINKFRQEERLFNGSPIRVFVDNEVTQEEKDNYEQISKIWYEQKDEYMARRIFNEVGYEHFVKYAESRPSIAWMLADKRFEACQAQEGQCTLFCVNYGTETCKN